MTGGARPRRKGNRIESEVVEAHKKIGIKAERYPLSGASKFRGSGHDVDIYAFGGDEAPIVAEVKSRKKGKGFVQLEKWLGEYDLLILKRNNAEPMVLLPWRIWARLLTGESWRPESESPKRKKPQPGKTSAKRAARSGEVDGTAPGATG
jgi:hypothetical protein